MAKPSFNPAQDSLPGIDCGCRPVCRVWERKQQAGRLYDRAVRNMVDADREWSEHWRAAAERFAALNPIRSGDFEADYEAA